MSSKSKGPAVAKLNEKVAGAKTVTVGLKSPNGLILRLFDEQEVREDTPSGPRTRKQFFANLEAGTVELKGYGGAAFGVAQSHRIIGQYALTQGVDGDFMRAWLAQNQDHDVVKNNLIFIQADEADAAAQGTEQKGIWDGLHPLRMHSTAKDPRVPKKLKTFSKKDDDDVMALGGDSKAAAA